MLSPDPAVFQEWHRREMGLRSPYAILSNVCGTFTDVYRQDGTFQAQQMFLQAQQRYDLLLARADAIPKVAREWDFEPRHEVLTEVVVALAAMKDSVLQAPRQFDADARNCRLAFQRS